VLPEFVLEHWWEGALHNQSAMQLKAKLRQRPNTVITAVPTHLFASDDDAAADETPANLSTETTEKRALS
jgi:hypothetical protein